MSYSSDMHAFLTSVGGVALAQGNAEPGYNFGIKAPDPTKPVDMGELFSSVAQPLFGRWDGKSKNLLTPQLKVHGSFLKPNHQRSGTCGGRAGKRGHEILQTLKIAAGHPWKFQLVSHAWIYAETRRKNGILGSGDGVFGGSVPPTLKEVGLLTSVEANDTDMDSPATDALADKWGRAGAPQSLRPIAADNPVKDIARCSSAEEMADAIDGECPIVISDSQGFTMTRDKDGFCKASGTWQHYHCFVGVIVLPNGRKGFAYEQSWGPDAPQGPLLEGYPSHVFGVDWDEADHMARTGQAHALTAVEGWQALEIPYTW